MAHHHKNLESEKRFKVRKALGLDILGYGNFMHRHFVSWCEIISMKFRYQDRDLIANESILKYYQTQWAILVENRLINEYGSYIDKNIEDTYSFYSKILCEYAEDLENYYPASLLPKNTKIEPNKYQFNYN